MLGWGVVLISIGGLSFVLPLLGSQFILVSLLGMTGMGSAAAGLVMLGVGALLVTVALKRERSEFGNTSSQQRPVPSGTALKRDSLFSSSHDGIVVTPQAFALADSGDADTQVLIGSAYLFGANGLSQDPHQAFNYLHRAATQEHGFAAFLLACLYTDGIGVVQNLDSAKRWALKAQQRGVANANEILAAIEAKQRALLASNNA